MTVTVTVPLAAGIPGRVRGRGRGSTMITVPASHDVTMPAASRPWHWEGTQGSGPARGADRPGRGD